MLRLEEPRLLESRALAPLLEPLNALPEEEDRLGEALEFPCEELGRVCEAPALGDGLGRLGLADGVGRLAEDVPVEGRAAALPVEGPARLAGLAFEEAPLVAEP